MISRLILSFLIFTSTLISAYSGTTQNYLVGDTLNIVALGGIKLRQGPGTKFEVNGRVGNGEQVVVKSITNVSDSIEFNGTWVEIVTIDSKQKGYAFDVFLSRFPVINDLSIIKKLDINSCYSEMPSVLKEYVNRALPINCTVDYDNGLRGEGTHLIKISSINEDCSFFEHRYYEGAKSELELNNARASEAYYLVKNIIKQMPEGIFSQEHASVNEDQLMNPSKGYNCSVTCGECVVQLNKKEPNKISINFAFVCC